MLMAVEREVVAVVAMTDDRLEWHLDNWRRYMKQADYSGLPGKSTGFVGGGYSQSFDDMLDASDMRCARAVDAIITGMEVGERAALHHAYLHAVFRFRDLRELLDSAKSKVVRGLAARGIY